MLLINRLCRHLYKSNWLVGTLVADALTESVSKPRTATDLVWSTSVVVVEWCLTYAERRRAHFRAQKRDEYKTLRVDGIKCSWDGRRSIGRQWGCQFVW